jgi:ribose transport system substrate-binding protein
MKNNYIKLIILSLCATVLMSACSNSGSSTLVKETPKLSPVASNPAKQYQIALVMKTLTNPFFVDMEKGARKAEKELNIKLIVKTGAQETSIEQQIQIVEELILQKVDAIVIAPGSSVDLVKVLKKAQDAGIKIVNIDNQLDSTECKKQGLNDVPFISVKNDEAAYLSAKAIASLVNGPVQAVIIEGIRDAGNAEQRRQGAVKAFKEFPNIQVVASESANWKIDEAHLLAQRLFTKNPNIKLVFCANDMMALGVIQYLKVANIPGVFVAGFDNLEDMRSAIKAGWAYVTIDQNADFQGYQGVLTAIKLIRGQVTEKIVYVDAVVITAPKL